MNLQPRQRWATVIGAALALSAVTGAGAYAWDAATEADAAGWYTADENAGEPDPDRVGGLTFYNAAGQEVTGGDLDEPLADFAVADDVVREGDGFATLYAYSSDDEVAPGAWTGTQLSGTSAFPVAGAPAVINAEDAVYRSSAADLTLADVFDDYENLTFEIRLRTSSAAAGVGSRYASALVQVNGSAGTWSLGDGGTVLPTATTLTTSGAATYGGSVRLTAGLSRSAAGDVEFFDGTTSLGAKPVARADRGATLDVPASQVGARSYRAVFTPTKTDVYSGSESPVVAVNVAKAVPTLTATVPASAAYGRTFAVTAKVAAAGGTPTGTVSVKAGGATLATGTLAQGSATITVPATALAPGARSLTVAYSGSATVSEAASNRTVSVAKVGGLKPVLKVTKKPTRKKAGKATVTVASPAGLVKAGGRATVVLTKGKAVKRVVVTVKAGKATAKLPKLPKGTWTVRVDYAGDAYYLAAKSKTAKVKSK
jgi:hypothetical protein